MLPVVSWAFTTTESIVTKTTHTKTGIRSPNLLIVCSPEKNYIGLPNSVGSIKELPLRFIGVWEYSDTLALRHSADAEFVKMM
jgi:hypothetical protein